MKREISYRSHIRTLGLLHFGFPPYNFSTHTLKINMYNKCFSTVCNEKAHKPNWATCVTGNLLFFLLKGKISDKR